MNIRTSFCLLAFALVLVSSCATTGSPAEAVDTIQAFEEPALEETEWTENLQKVSLDDGNQGEGESKKQLIQPDEMYGATKSDGKLHVQALTTHDSSVVSQSDKNAFAPVWYSWPRPLRGSDAGGNDASVASLPLPMLSIEELEVPDSTSADDHEEVSANPQVVAEEPSISRAEVVPQVATVPSPQISQVEHESVSSDQQPLTSQATSAETSVMPTEPASMQNLAVLLGPNNQVHIELDGRGWIFIEAADGIHYVSKTIDDDKEFFTFQLDNGDELPIRFQRQDLSSGSIEQRDYLLQPIGPQVASDDESNEALIEIEQPASIEVSASDIDDEALLALQVHPQSPEEMEALAIQYASQGRQLDAIDVYGQLMNEYPAYEHSDRALFALAELLEHPGENQDVHKSVRLYNQLIQMYPYSRYKNDSQQRVRYLRRSYLRVF